MCPESSMSPSPWRPQAPTVSGADVGHCCGEVCDQVETPEIRQRGAHLSPSAWEIKASRPGEKVSMWEGGRKERGREERGEEGEEGREKGKKGGRKAWGVQYSLRMQPSRE